MSNKILSFFIVSILLLSFAKADILSINSGGNNNLVINPNNHIEGFFFSDISDNASINQTIIQPSEGGGGTIYNLSNNQSNQTNIKNITNNINNEINQISGTNLIKYAVFFSFLFILLLLIAWALDLKKLLSKKSKRKV